MKNFAKILFSIKRSLTTVNHSYAFEIKYSSHLTIRKKFWVIQFKKYQQATSLIPTTVLRKTQSHMYTIDQVYKKDPLESVANLNKQNKKNIMKLANDTENLKHQKIPLDLAKLISQTRLSKGLSQKDLATKICEKVQVINDYEAGRAIPNCTILSKIERVLGIKLRGKERGQALNDKMKKTTK